MNHIKKANVSHIWSVLCQNATIDGDTNDLSLFKTIDELAVTFPKAEALQAFSAQAAKKPVAAPMPCELVTLWKRIDRKKDAAFDTRISFRDPDGKALQTIDAPLVMEPGKFRHRNRLSIPAVPMTVPGEYFFVVEAKATGDKEYAVMAEIPLDITFKLDQEKKG
jgi:hypothetical protein